MVNLLRERGSHHDRACLLADARPARSGLRPLSSIAPTALSTPWTRQIFETILCRVWQLSGVDEARNRRTTSKDARHSSRLRCALGLTTLGLSAPAAAHPDDQHGTLEGHLTGDGEWGKIDLKAILELTETDDLIADVTVSPDGNTAYLANWGEPDCAGPESGGQNSPDAGAYIVDISGVDQDPLIEPELSPRIRTPGPARACR